MRKDLVLITALYYNYRMLIIPGAHRRILKHFIAKSGTYLRSNNFANSGICYFWQFWWTLLFCQKWQFLLTPKLPKLDSEHTCYNTRRSILMKGGLNRYYSKANLLNHWTKFSRGQLKLMDPLNVPYSLFPQVLMLKTSPSSPCSHPL